MAVLMVNVTGFSLTPINATSSLSDMLAATSNVTDQLLNYRALSHRAPNDALTNWMENIFSLARSRRRRGISYQIILVAGRALQCY
jgi:hypothetical protein